VERKRYHVTIEQGGTTFRDDQALFQSSGPNPGNRRTQYLGNTLYLNELSQASKVDGHSVYTKALATAQPTLWLSLYGQFLYTQPHNDADYRQANTGNFIVLSQALYFTSQQALLASVAKAPHQAGQASAEIRLHSRLRVITSWLTDRLQFSGRNMGQNNIH